MLDYRVKYWTRDENELNFGDYLTEFIAEEALINPIVQADLFRLIGSAINAALIEEDLKSLPEIKGGGKIVFWGCGMRDSSPIPHELVDKCVFMGVRGPLSRDALQLPETTPLGDPGFLLPLIHRGEPLTAITGKTVCIPHFSERKDRTLQQLAAADIMLSPAVRNSEELRELLNNIASADFILCGSLHAAIMACAYDKPFAFWDTGFVDIPFKWVDFAASIGIEPRFVSNISDGRVFYQSIKDRIRKPNLSSILGCCPFAVKPSIIARALVHDIGVAPQIADAILYNAQTLWLEEPDNVRKLKEIERDNQTSIALMQSSVFQNIRRINADEIDKQIADLETLNLRLLKRKHAATLFISRENPQLDFAIGGVGAALIEDGWSDPNDVGPWSLAPISSINLPKGSGWEAATGMKLEGYLFAPHIGPSPSKRRIHIWQNATKVLDEEINNTSQDHTCWSSLHIPITDMARSSNGDMKLSISLSDVGTNKSLGIMSDARPIGLALAKIVFSFD